MSVMLIRKPLRVVAISTSCRGSSIVTGAVDTNTFHTDLTILHSRDKSYDISEYHYAMYNAIHYVSYSITHMAPATSESSTSVAGDKISVS